MILTCRWAGQFALPVLFPTSIDVGNESAALMRNPPPKRFGQNQLNIADIPFGKTTLTIAKIILPHSNEGLWKSLPPDRVNVGKKTPAPFTQGPGIVRGDILQVHQLQVRRLGNRVADGGDRRNAAARENIAFDKIHRAFVAIEYLVADGDGLQSHQAVGFQQLAAGFEKGVTQKILDWVE